MSKICNKRGAELLAPIPALLIGTIVMRNNELSPFVYGQNIICYLVFVVILIFIGTKPVRAMRCDQVIIFMLVLGCLAVAITFLDRGLENVHRWLTIGSFRIYISSIVLPCMIIGLDVLLQKKSVIFPVIITVMMLLMLALQPDASQLSAFAISIVVVVFMRVKHRLLKCGVLLLSVGAVTYSWIHIDSLAAVPHVEGILLLARDMGMVWFLLGIVSLALLLIPFLRFPKISALSKAVGLYYLVTLASTFFGAFPVPFMGLGISPIIGYLFAMFLLIRGNAACDEA